MRATRAVADVRHLPRTVFGNRALMWWGSAQIVGATGLALKVLLMAVIAINLQLWFNARFLKLSFWRFVAHQLYSLLLFAAVAELAVIGVNRLISARLAAFIATGFIYILGRAAILVLFPADFSLKRADLRNQLAQLKWNHS